MPRHARFVPAVASTVALALTLTACDTGSARDTTGAPGINDPYFPKAGNGGYDVTHYALTLAYDPNSRRLSGTAEIEARTKQDLTSFNLDLKGMKVTAAEVDDTSAGFHRGGDHELTIRPHDALDRNTTFRTTVHYSGRPGTITDPDGSQEGWLRTADGALALGEPTGSMAWFPGNHHPSDKATYDITITVPEGLKAVSNGELRREGTEKGRTTFAWHVGEPMASYVTTVAIGEYDVGRSKTANGLPVYVAVDPDQSKASAKVLARIPEIMRWAEENFGPYPFSSTGAIVDRANDAGYALETQTRPVFPGAPDMALLVHELAHQWYGNSVTPESWRDMWLNEGFATYAEWLWQEDHGGDTAQDTVDALYDHGEDTYENLWAFPPASPTSDAHISDDPVYQRGAMVLHKIRETTGDATFHDILRGWPATRRHGNANTSDFTAYVEQQAPDEDFTTIWDDWLYGDGKPDHA
ncbi:M1 family metallopeptidase [Streptomyces vastus]|uniref:Aminopeptidase N n=1 Tax=Streptomyces vastus TaxID=285451 RepID=A0ABN3QXG8_9ACTN